jgi:hypothetical protein
MVGLLRILPTAARPLASREDALAQLESLDTLRLGGEEKLGPRRSWGHPRTSAGHGAVPGPPAAAFRDSTVASNIELFHGFPECWPCGGSISVRSKAIGGRDRAIRSLSRRRGTILDPCRYCACPPSLVPIPYGS